MTATGTTSIYLLDVPEFAPLARALAAGGVSTVKRADYVVAEATGEIVLQRRDTGVGEAVWFGALTGGVRGTIAEFSEATLRVVPATANA